MPLFSSANPVFCYICAYTTTGPPCYIGWRNRFIEIDPGLLKRLQIRAQECYSTYLLPHPFPINSIYASPLYYLYSSFQFFFSTIPLFSMTLYPPFPIPPPPNHAALLFSYPLPLNLIRRKQRRKFS